MESFLHDISWVVPWRTPLLTAIFEGFTALGYVPFYLVALPLGYWLWDKNLFTRLAVLIIVTAILNSFLKDLFLDPRPDPSLALDNRVGDSYGLPSGHAQIVTAMWFWLAWEMRRWWLWVLAAVIVVGVGLSRIYLGVHDVEDVLAGVGLGLLSLLVFGVFLSERLRHLHDLKPAWQLAILIAVQPILYLLWPGEPGQITGIFAFMLGWWAGVLYDRHRIDFKRHPNWIIALVGATFGLVVLVFGMFLYAGKMLVIAGLGERVAQYIQMLAIALFVTAGAPWLFHVAQSQSTRSKAKEG
jgi:membrane-associated phospholipid phosphatase